MTMLTKEILKNEIDNIDEIYLEALYKIIKAFKPSNRVEYEQDLSKFTKEIDEGLNSPISLNSHNKIFEELRLRYV
ncbi:hypothetical protein GSY74_02090 [Sulfurovum sp. bin170]|uniref:hypothetical protein n=1 Tax=Sulfurovum sp. bin170 TaxID=2695268 RepID=UPI0013DF130A|nr:hypothetical protein [Sulfurovum sp. bin170]NEW60062.1 hypothetical protein [Sulfurovum sp. bin170]